MNVLFPWSSGLAQLKETTLEAIFANSSGTNIYQTRQFVNSIYNE
jgi:hypothetical protein